MTNIYQEEIINGKFHYSLEDPLSQFYYDLSSYVSPLLYKLGITPNFITTIRLIMSIIIFPYLFENEMYKSASVVYLLSYILDCLDGHYARRYNMETEFGDYYDHMTDIVSLVITMYYITFTVSKSHKWVVILIYILFLVSLVQVNCQERYLRLMKNDADSNVISSISFMCHDNLVHDDHLENVMSITRHFASGIFFLVVAIAIWNMDKLKIN